MLERTEGRNEKMEFPEVGIAPSRKKVFRTYMSGRICVRL